MLTCKSPRKVMRVAFELARQTLPSYSCKFSRKDFTLPQLFACLVLKEHQKRSYRGVEALLCDVHWWRELDMKKVPDHNTLCRAARFLLTKCRVNKLLDAMARWAAVARILRLSRHPLALDSTYFESHHVSRHYERRCQSTRRWMRQKQKSRKGRKTTRSQTVKRLPKLAMASDSGCHLVLSLWTGTGMGPDQPIFKSLVSDVRGRVRNRRFKVVGDAGLDSEPNHRLARDEMGLVSYMPPESGGQPKAGKPPSGRWRRHCKRMLATSESRKRCGYTRRWQAETLNSMIKRNLGAALSAKTTPGRKRDMALKVITHNAMIFKPRVETEHS